MRALIFISSILLLIKAHSQQDFILYHMPSIPQITQVDPASIPDSKVNIGLPIISSIYGSAFNTGFSLGDIFYKNENGIVMPDVENAISKMRSENFLILNASTDLLFVGFKKGDDYYSFNITEKIDFTFNYPQDLITMLMEGNGNNLLGKRASLDGLGFDFTHWREYAVHWVHNDEERHFSYGARLKYLYGMENFTTDVSVMGIETNANTHALDFDVSLDFRSSGIPMVMLGSDTAIGGLNTDDSDEMERAGFAEGSIRNYLFNRNNKGVGIDFGFNYRLSDKILLEGSILDLGFINWNDYTANSQLKQWNYSYSGIGNPIPVLGSESTSSVSFLKDVLEDSTEGSLLNSYAYSNPSYSTALRTKIYASVEYTVDHNNFVSLSLYSSFVRGKWRRGLGLAYNYHLGYNFAATASYSIYNRSYSNVGLGVTVNFGPLEIYCLTDNILSFGMLRQESNSSTSSGFTVDDRKVKNGQIHFGINLAFGRPRKEKVDEPEEDENRAKAVSDDSPKAASTTNKSSGIKTVLPTGEAESPGRTNYNSKGNSSQKEKAQKNKKSSKKSNYNNKTEKKENSRKGELKTKVQETAPKSSTLRKVTRKL